MPVIYFVAKSKTTRKEKIINVKKERKRPLYFEEKRTIVFFFYLDIVHCIAKERKKNILIHFYINNGSDLFCTRKEWFF